MSTAPKARPLELPTTEETPTEPVPTVAEGQVTYQVWFTDAEGLFVTYRTEEATPRVGTAALESLLAGPDSFEEDYGLARRSRTARSSSASRSRTGSPAST